jgi:hypothetical protein
MTTIYYWFLLLSPLLNPVYIKVETVMIKPSREKYSEDLRVAILLASLIVSEKIIKGRVCRR